MSIIIGTAVLVNKPIELKADEFRFEYGEVVNLEAQDILNTPNQEILDSTEVEINYSHKDDNEYPEVGIYKGKVKYIEKNIEKEKNINVLVEDTTSPLITLNKEAIIKVGSSKFDLNDYIEIKDLSEYSVDYDESSIDLNTVGTYPLIVKVKDIHDNQAELKLEVKIESETLSNTSVNELQRRLFYLLQGPNLERPKENNTTNWDSIEFKLNEDSVDFRQHSVRISGNTLDGKVLDPGMIDSDGNVFIMDDYDASKKEMIGNIFSDVTDKQWQSTRNDVNVAQFTNESKVDFAYFVNSYIYDNEPDFDFSDFIDASRIENEKEARENSRNDSFSNEMAMFYTAPSFKYFAWSYPRIYVVTDENEIYSALRGLSIVDDSYLEGMSDAEIRAQYPDVRIWEYDAQATNYLKAMLD